MEDVRFVFLSLTKELGEGLKKGIHALVCQSIILYLVIFQSGQTEKIDYITKAMRCLFTIYVEPLEVLTLLPNQPCTASPTFSSDLVEYSKTKEWQTWLDEVSLFILDPLHIFTLLHSFGLSRCLTLKCSRGG